MALVDVILPVHKGHRWVLETLSSLEAQTFDDWHLVVVDDACPEATGDLVAEHVPGATVLRLAENRGPAMARQHAVAESSAPFFAFLDQDDLWLPTKLARQVEALQGATTRKIGFSHTGWRIIDGDGEPRATRDTGQPDWDEEPFDALIRAYFRHSRVRNASTVTRREAWEETGGYRETGGGEDWSLWLSFLDHGWQPRFVPERLLLRREHGANASLDGDRLREFRRTRRREAIRHARQLGPWLTVRSLR